MRPLVDGRSDRALRLQRRHQPSLRPPAAETNSARRRATGVRFKRHACVVRAISTRVAGDHAAPAPIISRVHSTAPWPLVHAGSFSSPSTRERGGGTLVGGGLGRVAATDLAPFRSGA